MPQIQTKTLNIFNEF